MTLLFEPITIRGLTLANRIVLAPMCQYSCDRQDGMPTDWHLVHLGSHAIGGFGLVLTEATAVNPEGRISPQDTGLWNDAQALAWQRIVSFLHAQGTSVGVQLSHAGGRLRSTRPSPTLLVQFREKLAAGTPWARRPCHSVGIERLPN